MSPTPFHPTHTTPFKSSISSSRQARKNTCIDHLAHNGLGPSQWPASFSVKSLDSRHWTYLAEGGKNLLLRYEGPSVYPFVGPDGGRVALRMSKIDRAGCSKIDSGGSDSVDDIGAAQWKDTVLAPDLGIPGVLSPLLRLEEDASDDYALRRFLKEMAAKVEVMRPMERRRASGVDESGKGGVLVTEDLSAAIKGKQIISFEVKPKCGFLPSPSAKLSDETSSIKRRYSRYRMLRVLKGESPPTLGEFEQYYEPLDLYSGDEKRIEKSAKALYNDWLKGTGNLRVFVNGDRTEADKVEELDELAKTHFASTSLQGMIASHLASKEGQKLLERLAYLQHKYDDLDVEGVSALYLAEYGVSLTDAKEPPVSLGEYQEAIRSDMVTHSQITVRQAIVRLLLSAMYKDCSLFVRCISSSGTDSIAPSFHLVDLDPKPVSKLGYFEQIDKDVIHNFRGWMKTAGLV
ncbi:hypothetical protein CBS101457_003229 [Exobasidium rhododendri]|nr:hypothetical protein CBS101457_003229 [Exobasidium rhododendri]